METDPIVQRQNKMLRLKILSAPAKYKNANYLHKFHTAGKWNQKNPASSFSLFAIAVTVFAGYIPDLTTDLSEYDCAGRTRTFGKSPTHHILLDLAVGHWYADGQLFWREKHDQSTLNKAVIKQSLRLCVAALRGIALIP